MELIKQLFDEHADTLINALSNAGFTTDQAQEFLPEAASSVIDATENMEKAQVITALTSGDKSELLNTLNLDSITSNLNLDSEQVSQGMSSIVSTVSEIFVSNSGVTGALSSMMDGSGDDALNIAKKLFS